MINRGKELYLIHTHRLVRLLVYLVRTILFFMYMFNKMFQMFQKIELLNFIPR